MVSSYLELNLCMCVCVCGQNAPRGKNLERQKLELDYYLWFCSAVLWGVKWPAFLSSSNKFKLIISKINNKMVRIDYLPRAIEKKKSAHIHYIDSYQSFAGPRQYWINSVFFVIPFLSKKPDSLWLHTNVVTFDQNVQRISDSDFSLSNSKLL